METLSANKNHSKIDITRKFPDPDWISDPLSSLPLKYQYKWYMKDRGFWANIREVAAQELFRFYLPYHPKTRLVLKDGDTGVSSVVSKEVKDKQLLSELRKEDPAKLKADLVQHRFKGLGGVLLLSYFLNEIDLKLENLMVDAQSRIVKFDSEFCFNSLREKLLNYELTAQDYNQLPFVTDYQAANWLDILCYYFGTGYTKVEKSTIFDKDFAENIAFRAELNAMTMYLLISPPIVFERLIDSCIPVELKGDYKVLRYIEDLAELCVIRREQLYAAATHNESFQAYMQSDTAFQQMQEFIRQIKSFQTTGKRTILIDDVVKEMNQTFLHLMVAPVEIAADVSDEYVNLHFNA